MLACLLSVCVDYRQNCRRTRIQSRVRDLAIVSLTGTLLPLSQPSQVITDERDAGASLSKWGRTGLNYHPSWMKRANPTNKKLIKQPRKAKEKNVPRDQNQCEILQDVCRPIVNCMQGVRTMEMEGWEGGKVEANERARGGKHAMRWL